MMPSISLVSFAAAVGFGLAGSLLYGISLVIYRLTLQSLARFPGPKLADGFARNLWYVDACLSILNEDELTNKTGFGGSLGLCDSEEKAMEFMHTMNTVAVVTPFFKQFPTHSHGSLC
jgi:hypothetical protein